MQLTSDPTLGAGTGEEPGQCASFHTHAGMGKLLAPLSGLRALSAMKLGRREEAAALGFGF